MTDKERNEQDKNEEDEGREAASSGEEEVDTAAASDASREGKEEPGSGEEDKLSEEELHRIVEESLEKVTVADIVLSMMNQLASVAYLKMGMPENVNLKYRDFEQARLAIDSLEAMIKAVEGKLTDEGVNPFRGTLANLQMNFVQLRQQDKGESDDN
ncbi:MAG: DUF1844 domain-containing protein [Actinomycetota bacterium]|nr:DUF1844 domain-containing protein [Actinomycetota bacterium]